MDGTATVNDVMTRAVAAPRTDTACGDIVRSLHARGATRSSRPPAVSRTRLVPLAALPARAVPGVVGVRRAVTGRRRRPAPA